MPKKITINRIVNGFVTNTDWTLKEDPVTVYHSNLHDTFKYLEETFDKPEEAKK